MPNGIFTAMYSKIPTAYIKQISRNITDEDAVSIIECAQQRQLKKGEVILKEGEICHAIYLVYKGYLRNFTNKEDGETINLNFTMEGSYTTNLKSFYKREPSEFNIEAGEDAAILVFDFNERSKFGAKVELFVRRVIAFLYIASEQHNNFFKMYSPTERYQFIEKNNPQLLQRISLSQMASYLGVTRKTLSRIRAKKTVPK